MRYITFISRVLVGICIAITLATCKTIAPTPPTETSPQPTVDSEVLGNLFKNYDLIYPDDDRYKYVVSIREDNGTLLASGVLISPNFVLTAAHVSEYMKFKSDTIFYINYNDGGKPARSRVNKMWSHPDFHEDRIFGGIHNDLGIIKMCTSITSILPAKLNNTKYFLKFNHLSSITTVGFSFDKKKSSKPFVFRYYGTLESQPGNMKFLCNRSSIYYGDSGGAVVLDGRVVGILSSFLIIDSTALENSATRVDRYAEWIANTMLNSGN